MKKYNTVLNVILVISVSAILILVGFWLYDSYSKNKIEKDAMKAIEEFNKQIGVQDTTISNIAQATYQEPEEEQPVQNNNNNNNNNTSNNYNKYKNYTVLGTIQIPRTNVNYPVLAENSPSALNVAVSYLYGPGLNKIGNTTIIGHNNRNGLFFSNNKKLMEGDTIFITDEMGQTIAYEIYSKYETTDTDAEYMTRDTNGAREISLSTCTDDGKMRIIILAKEHI